MTRILLNGLGPEDTITYKKKRFWNGAAIDMKDEHAKAYIDAKLAVKVEDERQVRDLQKLEIKNDATRKRIEKKAAEIGVEE